MTAAANMAVAQNEGARATHVLVFGSIYQGGHVGTFFFCHSHMAGPFSAGFRKHLCYVSDFDC